MTRATRNGLFHGSGCGLSNADIAAELHLSEHAVHRHVANIYNTLGISSRRRCQLRGDTHGVL